MAGSCNTRYWVKWIVKKCLGLVDWQMYGQLKVFSLYSLYSIVTEYMIWPLKQILRLYFIASILLKNFNHHIYLCNSNYEGYCCKKSNWKKSVWKKVIIMGVLHKNFRNPCTLFHGNLSSCQKFGLRLTLLKHFSMHFSHTFWAMKNLNG